MVIKINPNLEKLPTKSILELIELQGQLKILTKENHQKLRKSLEEKGLLMPFMVWVDPITNTFFIVDGHQRKKLFLIEKYEPLEVPYLVVPGETIDEAKENLLIISSQYGKITEQGFNEFTIDLPDEWIEQTIHFDALMQQMEDSLAPAISLMPETLEIVGFKQTHILISFPPEKLVEIQEQLEFIKSKSYVEYEQGSN